MNRIKAMLTGIKEYRYDITTNYPEPLIEWYDRGRALARYIRKFD